MSTHLSYVQLSSSINPSFWNKLTELKLNVDKLNETERNIWGYFSLLSTQETSLNLLEVDSTSFNRNFDCQNMYLPFQGKILNKNTIEQFKECNKMDLINGEGKLLVERIKSGVVLNNPSLLNAFLVIAFADLKKYHYYYWFAFPVPNGLVIEKLGEHSILNEFSNESLQDFYQTFKTLEYTQKTYFIAEKHSLDKIKIHSLSSKISEINEQNVNSFYFVFYNITHSKSNIGSQIRNFVALILNHCKFLVVLPANFISLKLSREDSYITVNKSSVLKLKLPSLENLDTWVGWEKNERDKMGPKMANMKFTLDPVVIAENSVDLNLKLMKWRVLPNIDLDKIKTTNCLLLGSGTLGCSVARTLLAWGVRNITFLDNSTVSFSNPVRQSLFTYEDSVQMKPKALAAAESLKKIFPGVNSKAVQLNIPMPGHTIGESTLEQVKDNVKQLDHLIHDNDIIFLLTDSRESRWLPTLLSNVHQKIVINAALGFDTYLIMRHGVRSKNIVSELLNNHPEGFKSIKGNDLGCYFCNDVTAPGNSTKDRTLDQQCTVTRPGVSQIAGALAVELGISILQHKEGCFASAFYSTSKNIVQDLPVDEQSLLGLVPHSIRGFLSSFEQILPATQKYKHCVACSEMVLKEYEEKGFEFLFKVFNSSKHLEDIALLTTMLKETDFGEVLEFSDDDFDAI